jgi:protein-tyrosine phosphatase
MKYTITFLLLGGLVSYFAITLGGWWQILHWFSVSCILLSGGYAGLGPLVFGKGHDGRIPVWSKIVHLPFMLYCSLVWHLVRIFSRENPTDEVSGDLILGRRLLTSEMLSGISNYVDLTAEMEDPRAIRERESYVAFPILDADVPAPLALKKVVAALRPGKTFVHCAQGHGRTGLFALALLAERGRISYDEGIAKLTAVRPGLALNAKQQAFMRKYIGEQPAAEDSGGSASPPAPAAGK